MAEELTREQEINGFQERIRNHIERKKDYVNFYVWKAEYKKLLAEYRELKKK